MMKKILLINSSTRCKSNSELLASITLENLQYSKLSLKSLTIQEVRDNRFADSWPRQVDDYYSALESVKQADILVFASPIYWYSISGLLKVFIDRWSESLRNDAEFKNSLRNKVCILILVGSDCPRQKGSVIEQQFQYICSFLQMNFLGSIIGDANAPGDVINDVIAINTAYSMNKKIKSIE